MMICTRRLVCRPLGAGVALTTMVAAATAADLGPYPASRERAWQPPVPASAAFNWTGLYAGGQAGYGWGDIESVALWGQTVGASESFSYGPSGVVGGLHLGFNRQSDRLVVGIEADIEASDVSGSGPGTFGAIHSASIDWVGSLRGRLGFTAGRSLLFVTGGVAYAGVSLEQYTGTGLAPFSGDSFSKAGWTVGAGLEHMIMPRVTARIEYRYLDLGKATYFDSSLNMRETADISSHSVRGGLSFHF